MELDDHRLEALHHGRGLLSVRPRPHAEVVVRRRDPQLLEEGVGHAGIVMLAGVDDHVLDPPLHQLAVHRGKLHEVRAGADDGQDAHRVSATGRSEEHTSELQSLAYLVCRLLLEKKKIVSSVVSPNPGDSTVADPVEWTRSTA